MRSGEVFDLCGKRLMAEAQIAGLGCGIRLHSTTEFKLAAMQRAFTIACLAFFCTAALAGSTNSTVGADLVGNGTIASVTLVQSHRAVTVAVQPVRPHAAPQTLTFGVSASRQDAVCGLPASIKVVSLSCSAEAGPLPGCVQSKSAQAVVLSGGECDPIYIYWNHAAGRLSWWRN